MPFAIDTLMNKTAGIEVADKLSIAHIRESIDNLQGIGAKTVPVIDFREKHAEALI